MIEIHQTLASTAPPERLFAVLTDHRAMPRWFPPIRRVDLDPEGSPDPNGLGAVRKVHALGPPIVERVVEWEPPRRYVYVLEAGAPIRNHRGEVRVEAAPGGSKATWTITFAPVIPGTGWLVRAVLTPAVVRMLRGAALLAEAG